MKLAQHSRKDQRIPGKQIIHRKLQESPTHYRKHHSRINYRYRKGNYSTYRSIPGKSSAFQERKLFTTASKGNSNALQVKERKLRHKSQETITSQKTKSQATGKGNYTIMSGLQGRKPPIHFRYLHQPNRSTIIHGYRSTIIHGYRKGKLHRYGRAT
jgi:hypothetical protein